MQPSPIDNDFNVIYIISFMHRDRIWMKIEAPYNNIYSDAAFSQTTIYVMIYYTRFV